MNENGYSLSDVAAATGNSGFGGMGSEGIWIFALLLLLFGSNGSFGGNATRVGEALATQADVQRAVDLDTIKQGQAGIVTAIKDAQITNLQEIRDNGALISAGFANAQNCCCETNRNIDSVRFDMANYNNAVQNAIHDDGEKTRAMIYQNKVEALQGQINQLQIAQAVCGIPKVNPFAFNMVPAYPYGPVGPVPPVIQ